MRASLEDLALDRGFGRLGNQVFFSSTTCEDSRGMKLVFMKHTLLHWQFPEVAMPWNSGDFRNITYPGM